MYQERPSRVPGAVVWRRAVRAAGVEARILPDGCLDLIWTAGRLVVAGPDTAAQLVSDPPHARYAGLRFAPGVGPAILGVPAAELRDRRLRLDALWPGATVRRLAERVAEAPDAGRALEAVALGRLRDAEPPDPAMLAAAGRLRAGAAVAPTAAEVGLSERQLHRRSLAAFGYGPKVLARVLRLQRAVALASAGTPFGAVAAEAGYADQAHLAREVRALAGVPLGALVG
jgi:AraC-like DNA-binding protein